MQFVRNVLILILLSVLPSSAMAQDATANPAPFEYRDALKAEADAGDVTAMFQWGYCMYYGRKGELCPTSRRGNNMAEAYKYLSMAAKKGHVYAKYMVGCCYYYGYGGAGQDYGKARKCFEEAEAAGNKESLIQLSVIYTQGLGVKVNVDKGHNYSLRAAESGMPTGQYNYHLRLLMGLGGEKVNVSESMVWLRKAAEQEYAPAMRDLGVALMQGRGCDMDTEEAVRLMRKAAEKGDGMAWHNLGVWYYNGNGIEQDYDESARCYYRGWKANYNNASLGLNDCYKVGALNAFSFPDFVTWRNSLATAMEIKPQAAAPALAANQTPEKKEQPAAPSSPVDKNIPQGTMTATNTFVLIIANETYKREVPVQFALNDGRTFAEYCRHTLGIPEKNVHIAENATYNDIRAELNWLCQIADVVGNQSKIIFYYAGHGVPDESTKEAFLLPVDGYGSDMSTGYKLADLYATLGKLPSENVLVLLDACFSGSQRDEGMLQAARGVKIKAKTNAVADNMVVISAASDDETAYPYKEMGHGLFTYYLLKHLQETRGIVTYADLYEYLRSNVGRESLLTNGKRQTPTLNVPQTLRDKLGDMKL